MQMFSQRATEKLPECDVELCTISRQSARQEYVTEFPTVQWTTCPTSGLHVQVDKFC
jgi:hypothetical protein